VHSFAYQRTGKSKIHTKRIGVELVWTGFTGHGNEEGGTGGELPPELGPRGNASNGHGTKGIGGEMSLG